MKSIFSFLFFAIVALSQAQETPAPKQDKAVWISNVTLHTGNGTVLQNQTVAFVDGKITYVGTGQEIRINRNEVRWIDGTGKHLYPGIIALDTYLGLNEIEAVQATLDYRETGDLNPGVRTLIAYNTDSRVTPTVRSNGVLLAQVTPQGGTFSGVSSVTQLDAWNWEDAAYAQDDALHLNWPSTVIYNAWWAPPAEEQQKNAKAQQLAIETFFQDAKAYCEQEKPTVVNVRFEAMRPVFAGQRKIYVHTNEARAMIASVTFLQKYNIKPVIVGGYDAPMILDFLKTNDISIVIKDIHRLPGRDYEDVDQPYKLPSILKNAGIKFAISMDGGWQFRNLIFQAGTASAYGLGREEALKAITKDAADILGIGNRTGTIEMGKDANLLLCSGDLLDMATSNVEEAFIQGRSISLDNKQKRLYKKFGSKR